MSVSNNIDQFISETEFSGYQRIVLPDGKVIPGVDRTPSADIVFTKNPAGKSVLDVGCYYGFFLHEAIRRGALKATGLEPDAARFSIANRLAAEWSRKVEVFNSSLEAFESSERFDLVLLLNVMHHVSAPLKVMCKLASLCRGTLVVEFRKLNDPQYVYECLHEPGQVATKPTKLAARVWRRARFALETRLMERLTRNMPLVGVASVEYDRSFFFTPLGFRNMFVVHNHLFRDVRFMPSVTPGQMLAFCDCSDL